MGGMQASCRQGFDNLEGETNNNLDCTFFNKVYTKGEIPLDQFMFRTMIFFHLKDTASTRIQSLCPKALSSSEKEHLYVVCKEYV